jgi:prefoldin alpha subunit
MEARLLGNKSNLKQKIPEIEKTLKAVQLLKEKHEADEVVNTHYQLSDNVYVQAKVQNTDKVALWLGANVMVEYSFDEAIKLLQSSLESATNNLEQTYEDYAFLKDQKTTTEVNMSRVHNFGVKMRQLQRQKK